MHQQAITCHWSHAAVWACWWYLMQTEGLLDLPWPLSVKHMVTAVGNMVDMFYWFSMHSYTHPSQRNSRLLPTHSSTGRQILSHVQSVIKMLATYKSLQMLRRHLLFHDAVHRCLGWIATSPGICILPVSNMTQWSLFCCAHHACHMHTAPR